MNRDQVKGTAKDVAGKVQRKIGEETGDIGDQVEGAARQVVGKVQKGVGDVEQAAKERRDQTDESRRH